MKRKLLILPLLLVTTSCVPMDYNIVITYEEGAISSIMYYELGDNTIYYVDVAEFDNLSYTGVIKEDYIDTLIQDIQTTKYIDKVPLFVSSKPNFDFYGDVLYIKFASNEKFVLSEKLAVLYDSYNNIKEHWYGDNKGLTSILKECKDNHLV